MASEIPQPLLAHEVPRLSNLQDWLVGEAADAGVDVLHTHLPLVPVITWRRLQSAPGLAHVLEDSSKTRQTLTRVLGELPDGRRVKEQSFSLDGVFIHERAQRQTAVEGWVTPEPNHEKLVAEERALRKGLGMPKHWRHSGRYWVRLATLEPGGADALTDTLRVINEDSLGSYPLGSLVVGKLLDG